MLRPGQHVFLLWFVPEGGEAAQCWSLNSGSACSPALAVTAPAEYPAEPLLNPFQSPPSAHTHTHTQPHTLTRAAPPAEPALFLINPAGLLHVMVYSNASFARPDLKQIVQGGCCARCARCRCHAGWVLCTLGAQRRTGAQAHRRTGAQAHRRTGPMQLGTRLQRICDAGWTGPGRACLPHRRAGIKMVQDRKQPIRGTYY